MSIIDQVFADLRQSGRKAFIPFVTAGDPDLAFTAAVLQELARRGCTIGEVGVPYSDPIADGPVIQASYTRALDQKIKLHQILETLRGVAPRLSMPLVAMVSYAIVLRHGIERFVTDAQQAGLVGAIVPDLPVEESAQLAQVCRRQDFSLIQLVTPTTPRDRAVRIAEQSTGFLYYVSVTGITGERRDLPPELVDNVGWLRTQTSLPICIGFGISQPEHVRVVAPVADGVIVGSALVRRMAEASTKPRSDVLASVGDLAQSLMGALGPADKA
ncbi:MAG: tryptophan synthase subunit alpha [Pirellulaceae bacterium]